MSGNRKAPMQKDTPIWVDPCLACHSATRNSKRTSPVSSARLGLFHSKNTDAVPLLCVMTLAAPLIPSADQQQLRASKQAKRAAGDCAPWSSTCPSAQARSPIHLCLVFNIVDLLQPTTIIYR